MIEESGKGPGASRNRGLKLYLYARGTGRECL